MEDSVFINIENTIDKFCSWLKISFFFFAKNKANGSGLR